VFSALLQGRRRLYAAAALLIVVIAALVLLTVGKSADLVVYNGRSQYGDEQVFRDFEKERDISLELRGGTAPELFDRLQSEGDDTPADLLVTTDLANLWRAKEAGLLAPVDSAKLEAQVPAQYRDPDKEWWGLSLRIRTPMRSTERVGEDEVKTYEDLGDAKWKGKLCLRTSNNEYNQSLVADWLAKRGPGETERILRSWMANDPQILGSDVDVLEAIAAGRCDVGLTNHYYLGRILADDPSFPVAPAWPDQDGAGAHTNLSGVGLVKGSEHEALAIAMMEHLTSPEAQKLIVANSELAVNPDVPPAEHIADYANVKKDPIDVAEAGRHLPDAVKLMQEVGWK
jgi:iron(III) transport system substrate-binding protein